MGLKKERDCHFCGVLLQIELITTEDYVPPDVIDCPECGKRWRETLFIQDDGSGRLVVEEVDSRVRPTTVATLAK